tara:strand:- start:6771 stop:9113 length:2343 start_codon:yes stop_codon:yes gene_type:complete
MPLTTPRVNYDLIRLGGGLDQVTPTLSLPPGVVRRAANFECSITGGYTRIAGYERFDGRPSPSAANYNILVLTFTATVTVGQTVTGSVSGATGRVIAVNTASLVITRETGTFAAGDVLNNGFGFVGTITSIEGVAADGLTDAQYQSLAADNYRADITVVPGTGSILGVAYYNGVCYAWRLTSMYKSTSTGWVAVSLGKELSFTAGGGLVSATGTITLATGAAGSIDTLTVNGVSIISGAVSFVTSLAATATALAANINAHTSVPDYTASVVGTTVTITAVTGGTGSNGFVVAATYTTLTGSTTNMTGGAFGSTLADGIVITGVTSGATATVSRVVLESGSFAAGTAAGRFIFATQTGTFQSEFVKNAANVNIATIAGNSSNITLTTGGRYETVVANFGGGTANYKLYGCDGVNRAFEFDGTTFVPIVTGMAVDTPDHIAFHKQHLFLSFGASLQFSGLGYPYQWVPLLGAGEIAMNAEVTNLLVLPGDQSSGALGVYTRQDTSVLYGTSSANFSLSTFNSGTGAIAYTAQNMDQAYVLDDRGIISLGTSLNFGNFVPASLTMNIPRFIQQHRELAVGSTVNRDKGQYRVFFSDGSGLYMTILNGKLLGSMPIQFGHNVNCSVDSESPTGGTVQFFGSTNGYVYQMDLGTSFDGDPIPANINLVYNSTKSPRILKRYRKAAVELSGDSYAEIQFGYDLGYRTTALTQPADASYQNDLRSSYWDEMVWDNFVWDGADISPSEIEVTGTAENMSIRVSSNSDLFEPFTVNNVIVHYTTRRGIR